MRWMSPRLITAPARAQLSESPRPRAHTLPMRLSSTMRDSVNTSMPVWFSTNRLWPPTAVILGQRPVMSSVHSSAGG